MRFRRGHGACLEILLAVLAASGALAFAANDTVDLSVVHRIREEALKNSQVMQHLFYLTDVHGPRLTNSPGFQAAADWVVQQAKKWGLEKAQKETWGQFGQGWSVSYFSAHLIEPQYAPLIAVPLVWTPGTNGVVTGTPILAPLRQEEDLDRYRAELEKYLAQYKGKLKGQLVMLREPRRLEIQEKAPARRLTQNDLTERAAAPEPVEPIAIDLRNPQIPTDPDARRRFFAYAPRPVLERFRLQREELRDKLNRFLTDEGVRLVIHPARGDGGGTIFPPITGSQNVSAPTPPASIALTPEHYNRLARLIEQKIPVRIQVESKTQFHRETLEAANVIAEIPGASKRDELVIIGAHLDSWESGAGATDNAAGCAVMMEAMRILKALNLPLDRTVRLVLWSGEEQGLLGSRAYVKQHFGNPETMELKPDHTKVSAYYNFDNGTGKIRGIHLQGNDMVRPIFESYLAPFRDLGATTVSIRNTGGTDHLSFDDVGLPGFQFIQDPVEYETRTHHSNMDVYDRLQPADLMQASAIVASFVYHTANRSEKLPRKPLPKPWPKEARTK